MRDPSILKKFSQKDDSSPVIFTGDKCVVTILQKLEMYGCLSVQDVVTTLGVFDMEVDGIETGCFVVARVKMVPSEVENVTIDGTQYVRLTFYKGDVFMQTTQFVVEDKLAFYVWKEFINSANVLKAMSYTDQATIFDRMRASAGITFPVDHVVFESIFAHLSRSTQDLTLPYRNTDMKDDFRRISLSDVAHAARSTSARIIGAYFTDGLNASLDHPSDSSSRVEDLLRS
jgi:hypothetical protein